MKTVMCIEQEKNRVKEKLVGFLKESDILYELIECEGCDRFCIDLRDSQIISDACCFRNEIAVQASDGNVYRISTHEILYIAIENRKSVLYLRDGKIETNYHMGHWKDVIPPGIFAQPHYSFIVNLFYVEKITKEAVTLKCGTKEYQVYTSQRKIGSFKKAFRKFMEH